MESPAGSDGAVCCMCGDHGLPGELFKCGLCLLRLQHRYCSELYPREVDYRSCNWCLREEGSGGGRNPSAKTPSTAASKRSRRDSNHPSCGCSRTAFSAEPGKPVKKPKKNKGPAGRTTEEAGNGRREVQAGDGRKARRVRVKVRRYKLLAEVIC